MSDEGGSLKHGAQLNEVIRQKQRKWCSCISQRVVALLCPLWSRTVFPVSNIASNWRVSSVVFLISLSELIFSLVAYLLAKVTILLFKCLLALVIFTIAPLTRISIDLIIKLLPQKIHPGLFYSSPTHIPPSRWVLHETWFSFAAVTTIESILLLAFFIDSNIIAVMYRQDFAV